MILKNLFFLTILLLTTIVLEQYTQKLWVAIIMEAIVIDTRYNGGGHMHEDIEVLFSRTKYLTQLPRGQKIGE